MKKTRSFINSLASVSVTVALFSGCQTTVVQTVDAKGRLLNEESTSTTYSVPFYPRIPKWKLPTQASGLGLTALNGDKRLKPDDYLQELSSARGEVLDVVQQRMQHDFDVASANSRRKVTVGLVGIGTSIAAAALTTASPANAVWVAGLSGISGGVVAYQTSLESQGYSREAVAAIQNNAHQQIAKRMSTFDAAYEQLKTYTDALLEAETDPENLWMDQWGYWQAVAENSLWEIYYIAASPLIAVGGDDAIANFSNLQKQMLQSFTDQLESLQGGKEEEADPPPEEEEEEEEEETPPEEDEEVTEDTTTEDPSIEEDVPDKPEES